MPKAKQLMVSILNCREKEALLRLGVNVSINDANSAKIAIWPLGHNVRIKRTGMMWGTSMNSKLINGKLIKDNSNFLTIIGESA